MSPSRVRPNQRRAVGPLRSGDRSRPGGRRRRCGRLTETWGHRNVVRACPAQGEPGHADVSPAVEGVHRADRRGRRVVRPATHLNRDQNAHSVSRRVRSCASSAGLGAGPPAPASSRVISALHVDEPAGELGRDGECEPGGPRLGAVDRGGERLLGELPADGIRARDDGRRTGHVQEQAELTDHGPGPAGRHRRRPSPGASTTSTVPSTSR